MTTEQLSHIEVQTQPDHLNTLAKANPLAAIAELIWNGFDADAHKVDVSITLNDLGGVDRITIVDDGSGLPYVDVTSAFGKLGGSWKKTTGKSLSEKRILHGEYGKGRFKAFSLGERVSWDTVYLDSDRLLQYRIMGHRSDLKRFSVEEPREVVNVQPGTIVTITEITEPLGCLSEDGIVADRLAESFALYLREYPAIKLFYNDNEIIPSAFEKDFQEYELNDIDLGNGTNTSAILQIVEWKTKRDRKIFLCDKAGFTLHEIDVGIRPGGDFHFTAYLRSSLISELNQENRLVLDEFEPGLKSLVETAREKMRAHFREKKALAASELVNEWKEEGIYPYSSDPSDSIDIARRQVFDICALNVHEYLADFRRADKMSRKFTFRILREAIEGSPAALQRILNEVLNLPSEKREELAELLNRTTLSAIIEANKLVTDRLAFLKGLEELLFNNKSKKELEERSQLHKILEQETWIFGEKFHLTASDENLTTVLRKYIMKLRPGEKIDPVKRDDDSQGIIDLLLSREIPQNYEREREFLVVELKRPNQKIDLDVKNQIESYALAVVDDERFNANNTHWTFLAVSNEITKDAMKTINQSALPHGYFNVGPHYRVGLATWSEVIDQCRTRLEIYRKKLGYTATTDDGVSLLRERYKKYLPSVLLQGEVQGQETQPIGESN